MTYSAPHLRLVAIGKIYNDEAFSFGVSMIGPEATVAPPTVPAAVYGALATFFASGSMISQYAKLTSVKLNLIGENGRYVNQDTVEYEYPTPIAGTGSSAVPAQIALAVSLVTPLKRGRASRGRFYLPMPAGPMQTSGQYGASWVADVVLAAHTFLQALNNALPGWQVGVVSDIGVGTEQPVINVRVGHVADTIRSRRTNIPELYATYPTDITG